MFHRWSGKFTLGLQIKRCYQTFYDVLGIPQSASTKEIKDAFIKQSKLSHPDLHPSDSSKHEHFLQVNEAHDILTNTFKRRDYDEQMFGRSSAPSIHNRWSRDLSGPMKYYKRDPEQDFAGWGKGPFAHYPKDARGHFGIWNMETSMYDFDHPMSIEMKEWADTEEG